jgi:predicted nucleotidyltransferase
MQETSSSFAEVTYLDRERILQDLRLAASKAKTAYPEIEQVWLIGSLTGTRWTAASDADLIVVVNGVFSNLAERSRYQIHLPSIPTDNLVYSAAEFERLQKETGSFLSQNLKNAIRLL